MSSSNIQMLYWIEYWISI